MAFTPPSPDTLIEEEEKKFTPPDPAAVVEEVPQPPAFESPLKIGPEGPVFAPRGPSLEGPEAEGFGAPQDMIPFQSAIARRGRELLSPIIGPTEEQVAARLQPPGPGVLPAVGEALVKIPHPSRETVESILSAPAAFAREKLEMRPDEAEPSPILERIAGAVPSEKTVSMVTGATEAVADLGSFFTSPLGIATLGMGTLPAAAQKGVALAFAGQMASQTPELARQLGEQLGLPEDKRDYTKIANLTTSAIANTGFTVAGALHGLKPVPEVKPLDVSGRALEVLQPAPVQPPRGEPKRMGAVQFKLRSPEGIENDFVISPNPLKGEAPWRVTMLEDGQPVGHIDIEAAKAKELMETKDVSWLATLKGKTASSDFPLLRPHELEGKSVVTWESVPTEKPFPETVSPAEAAAAATRMGKTATAAYEEVRPRPVVPEGPSDPRVKQAQDAGADTIPKVLELFPEMKGSRESARVIRDQAFPETKGEPDAKREEPTPSRIPAVEREPVVPETKVEAETGVAQRGGPSEEGPETRKILLRLAEAGKPDPAAAAEAIGARFDGEIDAPRGKMWRFTTFDEQGMISTSFHTKAGASPETIRTQYEATRARYEGEPGGPRPPAQKPPEPIEAKPAKPVPEGQGKGAPIAETVKATGLEPNSPAIEYMGPGKGWPRAEDPKPGDQLTSKETGPVKVVKVWRTAGPKEADQVIHVTVQDSEGNFRAINPKQFSTIKSAARAPVAPKAPEEPKVAEGMTLTEIKRRLPVGFDESTVRIEDGKIIVKEKPGYGERWMRVSLKKAEAEPIAPEAPAAKVEAEVQKVATTQGQAPAKQVKNELVDRLEKAIEAAPEEADFVKPEDANVAEWPADKKITISIPGDGDFTIANHKNALRAVLERAKRVSTTAGAPQGPRRFQTPKPTGNIPADVWVESSEPTHELTVSAMEGGKVIEYKRKGKRVEVPGFEGKELYLTSDGTTFSITEPRSGARVARAEDTIQKAIEAASEKAKDLDKFDKAVAEYIAKEGERPPPKEISEPEWMGKTVADWEKIDVAKLTPVERARLAKSLGVEDRPKAIKDKIAQRTGEIRKTQGLAKNVRARLEAGETLGGEAGGGQLHSMVIDLGKAVFQKGMDFARWSAEMIRHVGETIAGYLRGVWARMQLADADRIGSMTLEEFMEHHDALGDPASQRDAVNELARTIKSPKDRERFMELAFESRGRAKALAKEGTEAAFNESMRENQRTQFLDEARRTYDATKEVNDRIGEIDSQADMDRVIAEAGKKHGVNPDNVRKVADLHVYEVSVGRASYRKLQVIRGSMASTFAARPTRHVMDQTFDATDTMANTFGRKMAEHVRIGTTEIQDQAASAVIAAQFNRGELPNLLAKTIAGGNKEAEAAVRYAMANWDQVVPVAARGKTVFDRQIAEEQAAGINTEYREGYLPGLYNMDLLMGHGRPFVIGGRPGGLGTAFKKGKTYATPFDAIAEGYEPRTLKLSELVEHRVRAGQKLINRLEWADSLRSIVDPTTGSPIVTSLIRHSRGPGRQGYEAPPMGYERRTIIPGVDVAVLESYGRLFDALTGASKIAEFEPGGIPVGIAALQIAGGIKHGLLLFDTFHVSRILQKQLYLTGEVGYKKGLTLLDYSNADLQRAVNAGDITQEMADYARANRPIAQLLLRSGLNVGRIQEALYTSMIRKIPVIGTFNKWVFEKMTRGAMMQAGLIEFERVQRNNPGWTQEQVAQKVSRDLNVYFGNLGRQGVFKSATMLDASRLAALAPQWVESMARSEIGGAAQLGKGLVIDPLMRRTISVGSLGAGLGRGLVFYLVATQLLNLVTRRQFTWQNKEKGHGMDAWIPDVTGKTPGYFISPLSVVAEITHDVIRYAHTEENAWDVAAKIMSNKSSPLVRATKVLFGGRDWDKTKITGFWNRAKAAAFALAPTPIPFQAVTKTKGPPGQMQRQLTASAGFKTEPAPSAQQQVYDMVDRWKSQSKDPKLRAQVERKEKTELAPSDYRPLKTALIKNDPESARAEYLKLLEMGKTRDQIRREFENPKPFAGGLDAEHKFFKSLTAQEKETYRQAKAERVELFKKFKAIDKTKP